MNASALHRPAAPFAIGLTGGIGSGKSMVADLFARAGAAIIDTDVIAHGLTAAGGAALAAIAAEFGPDAIDADGAMDRARMRERVFADAGARRRLEAILHPLIRATAEQAAAAAAGPYCMFVVPLLVESGDWARRVARVLVVDCPERLQIERVMARNGLPVAQVQAIMAAQASRAERLAGADDVILNDAGTALLQPQVERLHAGYLAAAQAAAIPTAATLPPA